MNIELKPCPFCGGEAVTEFDSDWGMVVRCSRDCGAMTVERRYPLTTDPVKAWNTRAERTCRAIHHDNLNESEGMGDAWEVCSECGALLAVITDNQPTPNFCPSCGAKVVE